MWRMAKQSKKADADAAKLTVYSRIDPDTVNSLDKIAESMRPKPTRAQLIDAACAEYVERHGKGAKRPQEGD
jgi:predicted transcriptional regulator